MKKLNLNFHKWKICDLLKISFLLLALCAIPNWNLTAQCDPADFSRCVTRSGSQTGPGTVIFDAGNGTQCNGVALSTTCILIDIDGTVTDITAILAGENGTYPFEITDGRTIQWEITNCRAMGGNPVICDPVFTCSAVEGASCTGPIACATYAYDANCACVLSAPAPTCPGECETLNEETCECEAIPNCPAPCTTTCPGECETLNEETCECEAIPNCPAPAPCNLVGKSCDDGDDCTTNDYYDEHCQCRGVFIGFEGTACDDGDDCTKDDKLDDDCNCVGVPDDTDSDGDGIPNCEDPCPYNIDAMVYADLKCGVSVSSSNFRGKSVFDEYGDCTPAACPSTGREIIYRLTLKSQADLVIHFKERSSVKKLNLFVLTDSCTPNSCLEDASITAPIEHGANTDKVTIKDALPGVYYIVVDGNTQYASSPFTLLAECTGGGEESCPDNAHYFESFEDYTVGKPITSQDPVHWSKVGNSARSPHISNDRASNYKKSLEFNRREAGIQAASLDLGHKFKGTYRISWDMYIETMHSANFGLFGGDNSDPWGTVGHTFKMDATKYQGKWFRVELFVDMDKNEYALFMDNRHFKERGAYTLNLNHLTFYSPPAGHFYVDNICYAEVSGIPDHGHSRIANNEIVNLFGATKTLENANDAKTDVTETTSILTTAAPTDKNELSIMPNPTKGLTVIELKLETEQNVKLELYSSTGQLVRNLNLGRTKVARQSVDLSDLPNGIYLVRAIGNQTSIIKKIILQQ